jgi:NADH dehydrogenase
VLDAGGKRVLILGGGFAGVYTAMALERALRGRDDFRITLVNRDNYFVYQPMLPEIISGNIGIFDTVSPLRRLLPRTDIQVREVEAVDLERRIVTTSPGFRPVAHHIRYDHLVLAMGNVTDFKGMTGLTQHALPFKNLGDALYLRNHLIHALEEASIESNDALRQALLTFVVAGGGFSGVEVVAELNDFVRGVARTYRGIDRGEIRVILLHGGQRILPEVVEKLGLLAQRVLNNRGVEIRFNSYLAAATGDEAILRDGTRIATKTLVSTVPSSPNPLIENLNVPKERGKVKVDAHFQVDGSSSIWALGDCALVPDPSGKGFAPPTGQHAIQEAKVVAHNIVAALRGGQREQFAFGGLGKMGSLGHHSAVAEIFGLQIHGILAWLLWRTVYLMKLPGWERRIRTAAAWTLDLILPPDLVQLKIAHSSGVAQEHFEPGQVVFNQGDLGDRLYIIIKGRCEVVRQNELGEQLLADLGPGECFGEMALLNKTTRGATVRCSEPMDVLSLRKSDFGALVTHLPALRESFEQVIDRRTRPQLPGQ